MDKFNKNMIKCDECNKKLHVISENTNRTWKNKTICDKCWGHTKMKELKCGKK